MLVILLAVLFVRLNECLPPIIRIGAIFTEDQRGSPTELAFKYAVYNVNQDKRILPNTTIVYDVQYVPKDDSFHTAKQACKQISFGVQAVFGPYDPLLGSHIQSITDALDIPHIEARVDLEPEEKEFSINLYPSHNYLNAAFKDMIEFLKWKRLAIIYEDDLGLMKLQDIIRSPPSRNVEIYIRQGYEENYRHILNEIKHKEIFNLIVDVLPENMPEFLRSLLQLQMNEYRYHYIFTTFDIETFDLEDFRYNFVNITAFRIVDRTNENVQKVLDAMEQFQPIGFSIFNKTSVIQSEPALMFDSVNVFSLGLHSLERSASLSVANLSCEKETPWADGSSLFNYINAVVHHGITGPIRFTEGKRSTFKLDILKLRGETADEPIDARRKEDKSTTFVQVGEWIPEVGINITDKAAFYEGGKPNITLKVITIEETPFVMVKSQANLTGNRRYEGFCVDLLESISEMLGFSYEIMISPDGVYGVVNMETQQWNGLVRELMDKKADLAVGSMTINYARESVIDFTKPFMNLGISILFKLPTSQPTRLFSFMNPLAIEIWLYVLAAYILVSFTMFVMARFSPYEWNNPHPCNADSEFVENQFSIDNSFWFITGTLLRQGSGCNPKIPQRIPTRLFSFMNPLAIEIWLYIMAAYVVVSVTIYIVARFSPYEWQSPQSCAHTVAEFLFNDFTLGNSFWFTIGTLMQQGSDLNPKAASTRIVGGIWWFFTLIIISSYTANLAAFLTVERMTTPIENAEDLSNQQEIEYGTLQGGSTMAFFRDSKIETYQKMWRAMKNRRPSAFVSTYEVGVERVMKGNYAFLMESTMLDYTIQRNCNLTQIGGLLNSNSYGIATPMGSLWRDKISLAILELQENGRIQMFYNKWWRNTGDICNREDKNKDSKANALGVENIGGVFVVLLCGLALAIVVAILEFCWNSRKNAQTDRQSLCSEMAEELRFAMRCHGSRQKPALRRSCPRCATSATYVPTSLDLTHANGMGALFVASPTDPSLPNARPIHPDSTSVPQPPTWRRRLSTAKTDDEFSYSQTHRSSRRYEESSNRSNSPIDLTPPPPPVPLGVLNRSPMKKSPQNNDALRASVISLPRPLHSVS